jgi:hypothetical protein
MTFKEKWLKQASKEKPFKRRRMERIANNPKALKRAEQAAKDKYGEGAIDWQEFLPAILKFLMTFFGL